MADDKPRKVDYVEKVKMQVGDLRIGMFVCELDRPWLETPFMFQGFELRTDADIEEVRTYCKFVYIDLLRTRVVNASLYALPPGSPVFEKKAASFNSELKTAQTAHKHTSTLIKSFVDDIRFGSSVDVHLAREAVKGCVDSVMRNPDAMMFVTQMRSKSEYLSQHAFNVCIYSIILGRYLGFDAKQLEEVGTCGMMHDMGKVEIADSILNKPGPLTDDEFGIMKQHTILGRNILMSGRNIFSGTVDVAYGHHENLDGTGYPRGLESHQLNQNCKIVSVVDKYDAITSARTYKDARSHLDAVSILNQLSQKNQIDKKLTDGFISFLGVYPPGTIVEMSTGEVAIVLEANPRTRLRPQVLVVRDADKNPVTDYVDMMAKETDDQGRPYRITNVRRPGDYGIDLGHYKNVILESLGESP